MYDKSSAILAPEKAVKRLVLAPTYDEANEYILQSYLKSNEKEYLACTISRPPLLHVRFISLILC